MKPEAAPLDAFDKGYVPVAMQPGRKVPAEKWRHLMNEQRTRESVIERWKGSRYGLALLCKGVVVIDVDVADKLDLALERCGLKKAPICKTPSGGYHVHGRMRAGVERSRKIKINGEPFDLLTGASLSITPPSEGYEWITRDGLPVIADLPLVRVGWTRERVAKRRVVRSLVESRDSLSRIVSPEAYCLKIPSVQGQNGSVGLVRVVCVFRDAGRTREQTRAYILGVWNPACAKPEWSEKEVDHALRHFEKR